MGKTLTVNFIPEEKAHRFLTEKDFFVSVEGWSKRRPLHWRGTNLFLEIAAEDCMCNTCIRRFESVLFSMRDRNISYQAGSWSKSCCVRFENSEGFEQSEINAYLTERIGLRVEIIEEVPIKQDEEK